MIDEFGLQLLNGNWGIAAFALMVICALYFGHEFVAQRIYGRGWRDRLTYGMRVSVAIFTLSLGIFVRSAETWRWRVWGDGVGTLDQWILQLGGIIAIVGFLCAIREFSLRLFGRAPWIWTLVAMVVFSAISVVHRLW